MAAEPPVTVIAPVLAIDPSTARRPPMATAIVPALLTAPWIDKAS